MKNSLLKGAITISVGGLVAKILGAFYRIPLTNILGAEGIGLYQMCFPIYCILLTFSSTGVPNSLAKLISQGKDEKIVLKKSLKIFSVFGLVGMILMLSLGRITAKTQGNEQAYLCYIMLSPSVLLTSLLSCFRGYFQGKSNMKPTAISQIIEQVVKLAFGLTVAFIFRKNMVLSAGLCDLSVTLSELVAFLFVYKLYKKKEDFLKGKEISGKGIILTVIPVTLSALLIPLARTADSFMIINILKRYTTSATTFYGLYSGGVESVIGVPVALCYGIACACIPLISKAVSENKDESYFVKKAIVYTLISGAICSFLVFIFSPLMVKIVYFNLKPQEKITLINLLKTASFTVLLMSLIQTTNAIFIAKGKLYVPCITLGVSMLFKIAFSLVFLFYPSLNIFATALSDVASFGLCVLLNFIILFKRQPRQDLVDVIFKPLKRVK